MPISTKSALTSLLLLLSIASYGQSPGNSATPFAAAMPLAFARNSGQIKDQSSQSRNDIQYYLATKDLSIFIGAGALHYQFAKSVPTKLVAAGSLAQSPSVETYRLDVLLDGANPHATVIATDKTETETHFYNAGRNSLSVNSFKRLIYKNIYPSIDWEIYSKGGELKYDFIVHEGGNPADIRLKVDGATGLNINTDGGFKAQTPFGDISEGKPYSYERLSKRTVASAFRQEGNRINFAVGEFSGDLVIDPSIIWSTYFGGPDVDEVYKLKNDAIGNVFITGITSSAAYIATSGSHQQTIDGTFDAFLAKFDKDGVMQWSTYFGGEGDDYGTSLALASDGSVTITGATTSDQHVALQNSHQPTYGGDDNGVSGDAFVAKFYADGTRAWSTYLGGQESDCGNAIVCDALGNVYIAGMTASNTGIATSGSYKNLLVGPLLGAPPPDAFLVKFSPTGQRIWGTYFGGDMGDLATCMAIKSDGSLFIAGETASPNLASGSVFQSFYGGGASDAFVAKFTSDGNPSWCTYFGGNSYEHPTDLILTQKDILCLSGSTYGDGRLTTIAAHQPNFGGGSSDGFITALTQNGQQEWGTFLGGNGFDQVNGLAEDSIGNIVATGFTSSNNNILQRPGSGRTQVLVNSTTPEGFVAKFNAIGQRIWGSYFSGVGKSVGCFGNGHIFFTGYTTISGLATADAYQTINRGSGDVLLARIDDDTTVFVKEPFADTSFCAGAFFRLNYEVSNSFSPNNEFIAQLSDISGNFQSGTILGRVLSSHSGTINCQLPAGITGNGYKVRIIANYPVDTSISASKSINIIQGALNTPSVMISMNPTVPTPGETSTFSAIVSNCPNAATFQWYINGQLIPGAVTNPYTMTIDGNDRVAVVAYCQSTCSARDSAISNSLTLDISNQSVLAGVTVYPNPNNGIFKIAGTTQAKDVELEVLNVVGQSIRKQKLTVVNQQVNEQMLMNDLPDGVYLLRLQAGPVSSVTRMIVSK